MPFDPRHRSHILVDGPGRAPARSQLKSVGFTSEDLRKPLVMVAHCWVGTMPCNFSHRELAAEVAAGIRAAGGTPMEVNTVAISDGISMGTEGMKASLVSRELIADSIELVAVGYSFDALVIIVGCDKTIPAGAMALARLNLPGLVLYSGSIAPGRYKGRDLTIQDVFEGVGEEAAGKITEEELTAIEDAACPGAGGLRRAVHGQHDGHHAGVPRRVADGQRHRRRDGRPQRRRRGAGRRARHGGAARGAPAQRHPHP